MVVLHDGQSMLTKSELSVLPPGSVLLPPGKEAKDARDLEEFNLAYELNLTDEEDTSEDSEDDSDADDDDFYMGVEGEVPVSLAVCVIVLYMMGGAWIFHKFEGWSMVKSFYFAFVTLTTMVRTEHIFQVHFQVQNLKKKETVVYVNGFKCFNF